MTRTTVALFVLLFVSYPATAQSNIGDVTVGYLSLQNDPRYDQKVVYSGLALKPVAPPIKGAELGIADLKLLTDASGISIKLDEEQASDAAGLIAEVKSMSAAGERFVLLDLPTELVDHVAAATRDLKITLINTTAHEDWLRDRCYPNLLHTAASDRQLADALVQLLRIRNWTNVLVLVGQTPRDKVLADTFAASAQRLKLNIVDTRQITLSTDSESRERNNTMLVTGGLDYDVVFIADTQGDFARYLPYATQLPRPVIGSTGLMPAEWQWTWDRDGATQVTSRYDKISGGRHMDGAEWSTWIAAKAVMTAYGKSHKANADDVDTYLRGDRFAVDGSKGVQLSFRSWDGQLRMPITLSTADAVIDVAPLPGFEHERTTLDTLGTDEPEHVCK